MEDTQGISTERCSETILSSENGEQILLLDTRPFMLFNKSHINNATNIHCPPILKRRSGGFIALENIVPCEVKRAALMAGEITTVIAYDQHTHDLSPAAQDSNLYSVLKSLQQQLTVPNVYYLIGGFDRFQDICPVLCVNPSLSLGPCPLASRPSRNQNKIESRESHNRPGRVSPEHLQHEPVEILPHVYLGNYAHASREDLLRSLGITALLNVSTTCENHFEASFRYMNIPVNDTASADIIPWFRSAIDFIDSMKSENGKVLVHCHFGVSRSATVCLAYLMYTSGFTLDTAFEYVRSRRDVINPNLNFMRQLNEFELELSKQAEQTTPNLPSIVLPQTTDATLAEMSPSSCSSASAFTFNSSDLLFPRSSSFIPPLLSPS